MTTSARYSGALANRGTRAKMAILRSMGVSHRQRVSRSSVKRQDIARNIHSPQVCLVSIYCHKNSTKILGKMGQNTNIDMKTLAVGD